MNPESAPALSSQQNSQDFLGVPPTSAYDALSKIF